MAVGEIRGLGANSAFARALEKAASDALEPKLAEIGQEAVRLADDIVASEFNTGRSSDRRRPGPHLHGSFRFEVTPGDGTRIGFVKLYSIANKVKVMSLNYGSAAHTIGAGGGPLSFPTSDLGGSRQARSFLSARAGGAHESGRGRVIEGPVNHPGTVGQHFLERALERAINQTLRTAVRVSRNGR